MTRRRLPLFFFTVCALAWPFWVYAAHGDRLVIFEVQITGGAGKTANDFVELYNPTGAAVDLNGLRLVKRTATGTSDTTLKSWTESALVPAHGFYLWANKDFTTVGAVPDATTTGTLADNNGVALRRGAENTGEIIDGVAWGTATNAFVEGAAFSQNPAANQSIERKPGSAEGNGTDMGNNAQDFFLQSAVNPKNTASVVAPEISATPPPTSVGDSSSPAAPQNDNNPFPPALPAGRPPLTLRGGEVVINEFLSDPVGGGNEWVEFFNTTSVAMDLTGWKLQDGTADNIKTLLGTIAAQSFFVAEMTSARLNNSGDRLMLRAPGGVMIDGVSYGDWNDGNITDNALTPARAGQAVARRVNGADTASDKADFALTDAPTPASGNVIAVSTVVPVGGGNAPPSTVVVPNPKIVINEFVSDPEDGPEWVELFNVGEVSVDLDDWWLEDGSEAKTKLAGTLVPGHFKVARDIEGNLNNKGDLVRLKNSKGEVIDRVAFGVWEDGSILDNAPVAEDPYSVARRKDGVDTDNDAADFAATAKVTKGKENVVVVLEETKVQEVSSLPTPHPNPLPQGEREMQNNLSPLMGEGHGEGEKKDHQEISVVPLADLRDLDLGTKVRVQGIVSAPPGVLGAQIFYLAGSGIQVYSSKRAFSELKLGDLVRVQGILGEAQGEWRIKIKDQEDVEVVGHGAPPIPHDIDGEDLGEELEGMLVRISGTLIDVTQSQIVVETEDGAGELTVGIKKTTNIQMREFVPGMFISVTGIVVPNKNSWRILPRGEEDMVIMKKVAEVAKVAKVAKDSSVTSGSSGSSATSTQGHPYTEATAYAGGGAALGAAAIRRRKLFANTWRALSFLIRRKHTG